MPALAPTDKPELDESLWTGELVAVEAVLPVHVVQDEVAEEIEEAEEVEDVDEVEVDVEEHPAELGMSALEPQSSLASVMDAVQMKVSRVFKASYSVLEKGHFFSVS